MNDFIDLPHLPECLLGLPLETIHEIHSHTYHAIKADRKQRGEPVNIDELAQEIRRVDGNHDLGAGRLAEALMPFLLGKIAQQPAEPDYKQLYEQMCERCDYLDAKLAECSEQPDTPAQEPSDELLRLMPEVLASLKGSGRDVSLARELEEALARHDRQQREAPTVQEVLQLADDVYQNGKGLNVIPYDEAIAFAKALWELFTSTYQASSKRDK